MSTVMYCFSVTYSFVVSTYCRSFGHQRTSFGGQCNDLATKTPPGSPIITFRASEVSWRSQIDRRMPGEFNITTEWPAMNSPIGVTTASVGMLRPVSAVTANLLGHRRWRRHRRCLDADGFCPPSFEGGKGEREGEDGKGRSGGVGVVRHVDVACRAPQQHA